MCVFLYLPDINSQTSSCTHILHWLGFCTFTWELTHMRAHSHMRAHYVIHSHLKAHYVIYFYMRAHYVFAESVECMFGIHHVFVTVISV